DSRPASPAVGARQVPERAGRWGGDLSVSGGVAQAELIRARLPLRGGARLDRRALSSSALSRRDEDGPASCAGNQSGSGRGLGGQPGATGRYARSRGGAGQLSRAPGADARVSTDPAALAFAP